MIDKARTYFDADMAACEIASVDMGTAAVLSARSPGAETGNEDAAAVIPAGPDSVVLAVADGLGGGPAGEMASNLTLQCLVDAIDQAVQDNTLLRAAILDGCETANRDILNSGKGSATTLAAVEIQGRTVRPYHVGDSTILVVGQRGKIKLLTTSHSPVGFAVEAGVLDEQEAMFHDERHIVSNVVGCPSMKIELGPVVTLALRDTLLLASDGLFDNLHLDEIVERVRKGPVAKCAHRLLEDARARMASHDEKQPSKPDDLTLIVYRPTLATPPCNSGPG